MQCHLWVKIHFLPHRQLTAPTVSENTRLFSQSPSSWVRVLVKSGCYNKMPKYPILSVLSPYEKFTSHSSRGWKPRSWQQHGQFLSKVLFWDADRQPLIMFTVMQREEAALWLLIRTLIPTSRALPAWPNYFPKVSPPNAITLGISFQHKVQGNGDESHYPMDGYRPVSGL